MSQLFTPIRLRGLEIRNRVWVSPMCQYSSVDGLPNDWHLVHLGSFARGGAGLVMTEATAVVARGPDLPAGHRDLERRAAGRPGRGSSTFVHAPGRPRRHPARARRPQGVDPARRGTGRGAVADADGGWQPVAPSPVAFPGLREDPQRAGRRRASPASSTAFARRRRALGRRRLRRARGARRARLPAARVPLAAVEPARRTSTAAPSRTGSGCCSRSSTRSGPPCRRTTPLFVRISATDWVEGGWDVEESGRLAGLLARHGVDLVDVSSGGNVADAQIPVGPGYQVPFARQVRAEAGHPHRRGRADHRGEAGRGDRSPPGRPTWCCSPGRCCATRTGRCAPPTSSGSSTARASTGPPSTSGPSSADPYGDRAGHTCGMTSRGHQVEVVEVGQVQHLEVDPGRPGARRSRRSGPPPRAGVPARPFARSSSGSRPMAAARRASSASSGADAHDQRVGVDQLVGVAAGVLARRPDPAERGRVSSTESNGTLNSSA